MKIAPIKLTAAAVLLACLTLPEYTCTKYVGPDGKEVSAGSEDRPTTAYREIQEKHYPLESFSVREIGSWLTLLAFVWPWPILVYWFRDTQWRVANRGLTRLVSLAEPLLSVGSGYVVWATSSLGTRAFGAYLALAANAAYLGAWVAEVRKSRQRGQAQSQRMGGL